MRYGVINIVVMMNDRFRSIGVKVGIVNCCYVLRMFDVSVINDMSLMYGNIMCVMKIVEI